MLVVMSHILSVSKMYERHIELLKKTTDILSDKNVISYALFTMTLVIPDIVSSDLFIAFGDTFLISTGDTDNIIYQTSMFLPFVFLRLQKKL